MLRNVFLCSELYFKAGDTDRRKARLNSLRNLQIRDDDVGKIQKMIVRKVIALLISKIRLAT